LSSGKVIEAFKGGDSREIEELGKAVRGKNQWKNAAFACVDRRGG